MNLFYTSNINKGTAYLNEDESRHCVKVLRMKEGDKVSFIDGKGGLHWGELITAGPKECEIKVLNSREDFEKRPYYLHIAISPTKNNDRFEWFLEKATEIGIDRITPLICERSERRKIREDRFQRVILSAVKQSVKAFLPELDPLTSYDDFLRSVDNRKIRYIAHCMQAKKEELIKSAGDPASYIILIGPEGDFSPSELEAAMNKGFTPVSLGNSRLRTETAGVVAAQIISDAVSLNSVCP